MFKAHTWHVKRPSWATCIAWSLPLCQLMSRLLAYTDLPKYGTHAVLAQHARPGFWAHAEQAGHNRKHSHCLVAAAYTKAPLPPLSGKAPHNRAHDEQSAARSAIRSTCGARWTGPTRRTCARRLPVSASATRDAARPAQHQPRQTWPRLRLGRSTAGLHADAGRRAGSEPSAGAAGPGRALALGDPHLLEGGERGQDGAADPDAVLALGRRDHLDLHGRRRALRDLLVHAVRDAREHRGACGARPHLSPPLAPSGARCSSDILRCSACGVVDGRRVAQPPPPHQDLPHHRAAPSTSRRSAPSQAARGARSAHAARRRTAGQDDVAVQVLADVHIALHD